MVCARELSKGGNFTDRTSKGDDTAEFHGMKTFVKKRGRPEVPEEYDRMTTTVESTGIYTAWK